MSSRVLAAWLVLVLVTLTGCNTMVDGAGALSGVPTEGPPPASTSETGEPESSGNPDPEPPAAIFDIGETGTATDESGSPLADITVAEAMETAEPPDEFSDPPANGTFLSVTVTIANIGDEVFAVAPFDFLVRYPDGDMVRYGDGSSGVFGYDDPLDVVDLAPGETITGTVVFDVDPDVDGQQIVYSDLSGRVLGAWNVP